MADRYGLQIGEQSLPNALQQRAHFPVDAVGAGLEGLGKGLNQLAAVALKKQEEYDMLRVEEANIELSKRFLDYMHNSDSGILHTRKLGDAIGDFSVTSAFEADSKRIVDSVSDRFSLNPRQRDAFRRVALNTAMPFYKQVQSHESAQFEAYRKSLTVANIENSTQMVLANPHDREGFESAMRVVSNGIELSFSGAPQVVVDSAIRQARSDLRAAVISHISVSDPIAAISLLDEFSPDLLPSAKDNLLDKLRPHAELVEAQSIVDGLFDKFGDNEFEALKFIRNEYSGRMENNIASAYKIRAGEYANMQEQNFDKLSVDHARGILSDKAALDDMLDNRQISKRHYVSALNWLASLSSRRQIDAHLMKNDPNFPSLTPDQRNLRVVEEYLKRHNISPEKRKELLGSIESKVLTGEMKDEDISRSFNEGFITEGEASRFKGLKSRITKAQTLFVKQQIDALMGDIDRLSLKDHRKHKVKRAAKLAFIELTTDNFSSELDYTDKDFRAKAFEARRDAFEIAVQDNEVSLRNMFGVLNRNGEIYKNIVKNLSETKVPELDYSSVGHSEIFNTGDAEMKFGVDGANAGDIVKSSRSNSGLSAVSDSRIDFLNDVTPAIIDTANKYNILPSVVAGIMIHESQWGERKPGNNFFGIKAGSSWIGKTVSADTEEEVNGQRMKISAAFRDYESVHASIDGFGQFLHSNGRYKNVFGVSDYKSVVHELKRAGYATGSEWVSAVIKIIKDNGLWMLDKNDGNNGELKPKLRDSSFVSSPLLVSDGVE